MLRNRAFVAIAALCLWPAATAAQGFPPQTITLIQGYAPGGSADTIARLVAQPLAQRLGVSVIVEPMPGAGGNIAASAIARAEPDGSTIGLVTGGHAVAKGIYNVLPFDPVGDFSMITNVVDYSFVLAVLADAPYGSLEELVEAARAEPASIDYGSAGTGTTHHLVGELIAQAIEVPLLHIPYRGEGGAITALLAGEIKVIIASPVTLQSYIDAGTVRPLAVTSGERWDGLPDVPTLAEAGIEGVSVSTWAGLVGPAGLPDEIVQRLHDETVAVLSDERVRERVEGAVGGTVRTSTPAEMEERVTREADFWVDAVEATGIERQ